MMEECIKKFTNYYSLTMKDNSGDLQAMERTVGESSFHCTCLDGEDSQQTFYAKGPGSLLISLPLHKCGWMTPNTHSIPKVQALCCGGYVGGKKRSNLRTVDITNTIAVQPSHCLVQKPQNSNQITL
ncbi:hypothetical protein ACOMHN_027300 [Nucella lapillus]